MYLRRPEAVCFQIFHNVWCIGQHTVLNTMHGMLEAAQLDEVQ